MHVLKPDQTENKNTNNNFNNTENHGCSFPNQSVCSELSARCSMGSMFDLQHNIVL